jgi:hypothetical protein
MHSGSRLEHRERRPWSKREGHEETGGKEGWKHKWPESKENAKTHISGETSQAEWVREPISITLEDMLTSCDPIRMQ